MTIKEFFEKARRGRTWQVVRFEGLSEVRCEEGYCPLGAVARLKAKKTRWVGPYMRKEPAPRAAAEKLGLSIAWAWRVARAADSAKSKDRPWLLKNLGIS